MESADNFENLSFSERSDSESTHSTPEDERIKRLFFTCDTNGDGFITYEDVRQVCIQLNMEYCVDEIMQQLGADANGRITYSDFVKRRSELLNMNSGKSDTSEEYESTLSESKDPLIDASSLASSFEMYSNPSSSLNDEQAFGSHENRSSMHCSEDSNKMIWGQNVAPNETESSGLSHTNSVIHESWEFDSGTHDLEIDTISLHKQIEASGIEMPSNINELLDLANKYYIDSINSIKREKVQIRNQMKTIMNEREFLKKQIISLKEEKNCITKEIEKKKLRERQKYEDKITELQSMIAELSQNLNYYQYLTIKEEDEQNLDENNSDNISEVNSKTHNTANNSASDSNIGQKCSFNSSIFINNDNLKSDFKEKGPKNENNLFNWSPQKISSDSPKDDFEFDRQAFALEIDSLKCKIISLESQIDLSAIHLNESKENAERLTVILGKYDANNTALQLALNYSDKALQVYQLLVKLLESEIGLVLANCRAAGIGKLTKLSEKEEHEEITRIYERANDNRRLAEDSALDYLLKSCSDFGDTIDKNTTFSRDHEIKLKYILDELKNEKLMIQSSIAEIEPFIPDSDKNKNSKNTFKENSGLNIENIVFLQDLIDMKEQNASLRSQLHSFKKENFNLTQQVIKLQDLCGQTSVKDKVGCDEKISQSLDEIEINEKLVNDLKKENSDLREELEKAKKKYLIKLKKLEHRIATNQQRNGAHVKMLQNRISILENDRSLRTCIETTL